MLKSALTLASSTPVIPASFNPNLSVAVLLMRINIAKEGSEMSEKASENKEMSDVAECQELIQEMFPADLGKVKERVRTAARKLGWPYSRTKDIWYGDARRIDGFEKEQLKAAQIKREAEAERKVASAEYRKLLDRIERLERRLADVDEGQSGPYRDALEQSVRRPGALGRSGDRG